MNSFDEKKAFYRTLKVICDYENGESNLFEVVKHTAEVCADWSRYDAPEDPEDLGEALADFAEAVLRAGLAVLRADARGSMRGLVAALYDLQEIPETMYKV